VREEQAWKRGQVELNEEEKRDDIRQLQGLHTHRVFSETFSYPGQSVEQVQGFALVHPRPR
jgi:hypothetical protein